MECFRANYVCQTESGERQGIECKLLGVTTRITSDVGVDQRKGRPVDPDYVCCLIESK